MLDGRAAALMSLHTARHGGGHLAGDERILRVVLKVAPAADRTMDVQRRGKPQMHAEVLHLLADDVTAPLHKIRVKALRQRGADGNGRAVLGLDLAAGLRLAVAAHQAHHQLHRAGQHFHNGIRHRGISDSVLALAVLIILLRKAQTGRAVGHDQPGNALDSAAALTRRTADMAACCADHRNKALCVRIKIADQKQGGVLLGQDVHLGQNFLGAGIIYRFTDDRDRVDFDDRHTLRALHRGGRGGKVGEIRAAQHIFCLQGRDGLAQMQDGGGDGFGAADTDTDKVITGLENIGGSFGIICFSSDAKVNSFLNTIRDGENPFSFKKILQLSDDPKVNESRSELLAYATIKRFGTDPRNYKPDGLAEMMKNYFHPYWFANEHLKQEEVEQGFQALSDRKGMLSVAEPNKNEMVDAGFRNGNGKIICSQQKLDEEAEKELNIYLEYLGRYKREYFLDDFHFYGWQVMSDSVEEPEAVKVDVDGEHYVHIEFNTKDHTPSPIMAALSFLFSKEMLYVKYASNDIAAYEDPLMLRKCGFYRCKAGHFTEGFGLRGYEAAEEACRMWGYTLSDYVSEGVVNGKYRVFWHKHKA